MNDEKKSVQKKKLFNRRFIWLSICIIIVSLLGFFSVQQYTKAKNLKTENDYKNSKISSLENEATENQTAISDLETETTELLSQNNDLNEKIVSLENTIEGLELASQSSTFAPVDSYYDAPSYDLSVNKVKDQIIINADEEDEHYKYLFLTVDITNSSSSEGYINLTDFLLKNSKNAKQPNYIEDSYYNFYPGGTGTTKFISQKIPGGDTASGTLLFIVGRNDNTFTLRYDGTTYDISVK